MKKRLPVRRSFKETGYIGVILDTDIITWLARELRSSGYTITAMVNEKLRIVMDATEHG